MVKKMHALREGDGTLLDNCIMMWGSGLEDGFVAPSQAGFGKSPSWIGAIVKRLIGLLALVVLIVTLLAAPASALRPDRFKPGPNPDLVVEDVCEFPVLLHE